MPLSVVKGSASDISLHTIISPFTVFQAIFSTIVSLVGGCGS